MPKQTPLQSAFNEKANIIGLAVVVATAAATLNPVPLFVGLVAEAAYLLFVPDSSWYQRLLKFRVGEELLKNRQQETSRILPTLCFDVRERYGRLEKTCQQILAQTSDGAQWFQEAPHNFEYLLQKYLMFASKQAQFTNYLASLDEEVCGTSPKREQLRRQAFSARSSGSMAYSSSTTPAVDTPLNPLDPWVAQAVTDIHAKFTQELDTLTKQSASEQDANTKAVMTKRMEIIKRRMEFVEKIDSAMTNLAHQMQLLEDTFGLINDEMRARTPEQILEDINDVVSQTDTMTRTLEDLAPFEQMASKIEQV